MTRAEVARQFVITRDAKTARISLDAAVAELGHYKPRSIGEWSIELKTGKFDFRAVQLSVAPPQEVLDRLNNTDGITIEHNATLSAAAQPNDERFGEQWALQRMSAEPAWTCVQEGGPGRKVLVAVVDSGISSALPHPDLPAIDPRSRRFIDLMPDGNIEDQDGHGTLIAGTIAAVSNNTKGIASITWRSRVNLLILKFYDPWTPLTGANAARAIVYAVLTGAKVINASWHIGMNKDFLQYAVLFALANDVLFVAAAGNEGTDNDVLPVWPASYALSNVVSVMATKPISVRPIDNLDDQPGFSNYGRQTVHLAAPGVGILSTHYYLQNPQYRRYTGTSPAAAHVTAAAAVIRALRPGWNAQKVRRRLMTTVDASPYLRCLAGGRLNLQSAICTLPS
jgi:subtilisin family serine protease